MLHSLPMRHHYLQAMGIEVWRLRAQPRLAYYFFTLMNVQQQPVGLLFADAILHTEEEHTLVEAIVRAMKMPVEGGLTHGQSHRKGPYETIKVIILLGKCTSKHIDIKNNFHEDCTVIQSYSPAELLANHQLKAATWKDVQVAMQLMHP